MNAHIGAILYVVQQTRQPIIAACDGDLINSDYCYIELAGKYSFPHFVSYRAGARFTKYLTTILRLSYDNASYDRLTTVV